MISRTTLLCACLVLTTPALRAADGIEVTGTGEATAAVTKVVLRFHLEVEAELASEALSKYGALRSRTKKAFEDLGVTADGEGPIISTSLAGGGVQRMMMGGGQQLPDPVVKVTEAVVVTIAVAADHEPKAVLAAVAEALDVAHDVGLKTQGGDANAAFMAMYGGVRNNNVPAQLVTLEVAEKEKLRSAAYGKAMEDARRKATDLAELSGRQIGEVASVKVIRPAVALPGRTITESLMRVGVSVRFAFEQ